MHTKNLLQNLPQPKGTLESNTSQVGNVCKKKLPLLWPPGPRRALGGAMGGRLDLPTSIFQMFFTWHKLDSDNKNTR